MSVGVLIELQIKCEYEERFLLATRLYSHHTRDEPGRPQVEILSCEGELGGYVIRESFASRAALEAHAQAEHARLWLDTVSAFVHGEIKSRRVLTVLSGPPPLPHAARPHALETSSALPGTHAEAVRWRAFAGQKEASSAEYPSAAPLHLPRLQVAVERIEVASVRSRASRCACACLCSPSKSAAAAIFERLIKTLRTRPRSSSGALVGPNRTHCD